MTHIQTFFTFIFIIFSILFPVLLFSSTAPLSFKSALEKIMEQDTQIPKASQFLQAAQTEKLAKQMKFLPSLSVGQYRTKRFNSDSETDNLSITSELNLFRFGADHASLKSADSNRKIMSQTLELTASSRESLAISALFNNISAFQELQTMKKLVKTKKLSLKTITIRYKRGLTPSQEVDKTQVDINNTTARLSDLKTRFNNSKASLESLLGHSKIEHVWPWINFFKQKKHLPILNNGFSISSHTRIKKAKMSIIKNEYDVKETKRSFLPRVDLSYSYDITETSNTRAREKTAMLSITMPIFDNLSNYSRYKSRYASLVSAKYDLKEATRAIVSEWNAKKINFNNVLETMFSRDNSLALSHRLYRDNFKRFQKGKISVNDLAIDQSRLLDSENLSIRGRKSLHHAFLELCHARGMRINDCLNAKSL